MRILLLLLLFLCASSQSHAQGEVANYCHLSPLDAAVLRARIERHADNPTASSRAVRYVPLRIHLVANANGEERWPDRKALDLVCQMNRDFEGSDIQFFLHEEDGSLLGKTLNDDLAFNSAIDATSILEAERSPNAMNMFIVKGFNADFPPGTFLGGYFLQNDFIVLEQGINIGEGTPASHEAGHFLSLLHTFHGLESLMPGVIQPNIVPPPTINGDPLELMNGTNCTTAGDMICDTPPDYGIASVGGTCQSLAGILDPNGTPIDPLENNIMSLYSSCSNFTFTAGQSANMLADLDSPERDYLDNTYLPSVTNFNVPTDLLVSPAQNAITSLFDVVSLDWLAVPGATHYLVEVSPNQVFSFVNTQSWVVSEDFLVVTTLQKNKKYYWRVRPLNASLTCNSTTQSVGVFTTGETSGSTQFLEDRNRIAVFPNPLGRGEHLWLRFEFESASQLEIRLTDLNGKTIFKQNREVLSGVSELDIPVQSLPDGGLFLLQVSGPSGSAVWKLVR